MGKGRRIKMLESVTAVTDKHSTKSAGKMLIHVELAKTSLNKK